MNEVKDTIGAYKHSIEDYETKHMDTSIIKDELDLFLSNLEGDRILDVGCGPGRDLKYFSEKGYHVTGIDLLFEFTERAMINAPNTSVYFGDMRDMSDVFGDDSFDGLWSMASMLHIPREPFDEVAMTMEEYSRVLRAGGIMFLSVIKGNGPDPLPASPKYGGHSKFFYGYGEQELKDLVTSSRFSIDHFELDRKSETLAFLNVLATNYK